MKRTILLLAGAALAVSAVWAQAPAKQPQPKSQKEAEAIMAVFNAQDPDSRMKAADELLLKFADTEFKAVALQVAAMAAQEKNDFEKMVIYAERSLEVDPKGYHAMIMLASGYAQRTREHDLDKEEKLGKADKYAKSALEILKTAPKPRPDLADEQWEGAKKDISAQAYEALGLSAMARKKYDDAITNFKTAIETAVNQDPATKIRLASAYNNVAKYDEAAAMADAVMADPQLHPQLKQFAQQEKMKALKGKEAKK
jgi:tetratricopeptide (TPR) repeat protein